MHNDQNAEAVGEEPIVDEELTEDADSSQKVEEAPDQEQVETAPEEKLDPWEQLEQEATKWKDSALRATAELENFRKRMAREKQDAIRFGNQRLLEDLLPVIDNFQMGMMAAEQDKESMIYLGMNMVQKQLLDFLENQGVKEVEVEGKDFDPNVHEAISQEEHADFTEGQIIRVQRKGYTINDRLIRPAAVVVAKASDPEESEPSEQEA